jgi:hypothetical protein
VYGLHARAEDVGEVARERVNCFGNVHPVILRERAVQ